MEFRRFFRNCNIQILRTSSPINNRERPNNFRYFSQNKLIWVEKIWTTEVASIYHKKCGFRPAKRLISFRTEKMCFKSDIKCRFWAMSFSTAKLKNRPSLVKLSLKTRKMSSYFRRISPLLTHGPLFYFGSNSLYKYRIISFVTCDKYLWYI